MTIYITRLNNGNAIRFQSEDRTYRHLLCRQTHLIWIYLGIMLFRGELGFTLSYIDKILPLVPILLFRIPIVDLVEAISKTGIKISSYGGFYLFPAWVNERLFKSSTFIPLDKIHDIIINEGFKELQVIPYLCVVVKNETKLRVLFKVSHVI